MTEVERPRMSTREQTARPEADPYAALGWAEPWMLDTPEEPEDPTDDRPAALS